MFKIINVSSSFFFTAGIIDTTTRDNARKAEMLGSTNIFVSPTMPDVKEDVIWKD
jgi:hypothetical protein